MRSPLLLLMLASIAGADVKTVAWTGWFSDYDCASGRARGGVFTQTNPECAKICIEKGSAPVFISEQAKAIFTVKGYPSVIDDLGYHLEVHATIDEGAKTITIQEVKRLEYQGASCSRSSRPAKK